MNFKVERTTNIAKLAACFVVSVSLSSLGGCAKQPAERQAPPPAEVRSTQPAPSGSIGLTPAQPPQAAQPAPLIPPTDSGESHAPPSSGKGAADEARKPKPEQLPGAKAKRSAPGDLARDGVGSGAGRVADTDDRRERGSEPVDLVSLSEELGSYVEGLELALAGPDCVTAEVFRDRVCELSERICRLADERPSLDANKRCGDGRTRCSEARRRFGQTCATP